MKSRPVTFNCILLFVLLALASGCETTKPGQKPAAPAAKTKKEKKEWSSVVLFLETNSQGNNANSAPIYRKSPIYVSVQAEPFLTFYNIEDASIVEHLDGFAIQLRFDAHGAFVLDTVTSANKGRRIAIFAKFPEPRWLAAPQIGQRNATGSLTFTPDATRDEAERFVRGLKNAIAKYQKRERF